MLAIAHNYLQPAHHHIRRPPNTSPSCIFYSLSDAINHFRQGVYSFCASRREATRKCMLKCIRSKVRLQRRRTALPEDIIHAARSAAPRRAALEAQYGALRRAVGAVVIRAKPVLLVKLRKEPSRGAPLVAAAARLLDLDEEGQERSRVSHKVAHAFARAIGVGVRAPRGDKSEMIARLRVVPSAPRATPHSAPSTSSFTTVGLTGGAST